jgi:beta-galactosidase
VPKSSPIPSFALATCASLALFVASCGQANAGSPVQLANATARSRQLIDSDWRFQLDTNGAADYSSPTLSDANWRKVQLPHDFMVEGGFDPNGDSGHGFRPKGVGWYRKTLTAPANPNGHIWLEFDGIYRDSKVWLNGTLLGEHQSGYTSFYYDVTPYIKSDGPNELVVRADDRADEGWWYEGGGIYRHVWLSTVPPVHVDHWGTFVTTPVVANDSAQVQIETDVRNEAAGSVTVDVESTILNGTATVSDSTGSVSVPAGGVAPLTQTAQITNPRLWSPDSPHMYMLRTVIKQGSQVIDTYDTPFGVRSIKFDADKGLLLNGVPVKIKGTANHQDFAGVGVGLTDNLNRYRIEILKSMGCNGYRSAHNPPTPEMLDACDNLGVMVVDENRHADNTWDPKTNDKAPHGDMTEVDSLIKRDRNHPSVIIWSLCNEEWSIQFGQAGLDMVQAINNHVKQLDPTRPTTLAEGGDAWDGGSPNLRDAVDIAGANYGMGKYDDYHKNYPNKPLIATEFASFVSTRGIYADDSTHGYQTSYPDVRPGSFSWITPSDMAWQAIATRPFVAGGFIWTGFEYRGEPTPWQWPYTWPDVNGGWGQMDLCGFPKDAFYYFKAVWGPQDKPVVHIFPHWNWAGHEGQPMRVCVYTNADSVQLYLNGAPIGAAKPVPAFLHAEWTVPYKPGVLIAKGFKNGAPFGSDQVQTTGAATGIAIRQPADAVKADIEDIVPVEVDLIDNHGLVVPDSNLRVRFSVSGAGTVVGADNGNPSDHDPEAVQDLAATTFERNAFNGKCLVLVRSNGKPGDIVLNVAGVNNTLKPAKITLQAK